MELLLTITIVLVMTLSARGAVSAVQAKAGDAGKSYVQPTPAMPECEP